MEIRGGNYCKYITKLRCLVPPGKLNIVIDGQFGSTGKGLVSSYLGWYNKIDVGVTNASTNAGHTFYVEGKKYVTKHLPVAGIMNENSLIYLCPGAIINPEYLIKELDVFNIDRNRVFIHPRAAVIEEVDRQNELRGSVKKIASTMSGVGQALIRKIDRRSGLAEGDELLKPMVRELDLMSMMDEGKAVLMEVPQGFDLSINTGLSYPHCTSREITIPSALADAQVHPSYLGKVVCVIRTFPIRVGHIIEEGRRVGDSGPFYDDSEEVTWETVGVDPEYTTNTKRVRRVATFSRKQYKRMLRFFKPDYLILNFANYLSKESLRKMLESLPEVTHVGYGPRIEDIEMV